MGYKERFQGFAKFHVSLPEETTLSKKKRGQPASQTRPTRQPGKLDLSAPIAPTNPRFFFFEFSMRRNESLNPGTFQLGGTTTRVAIVIVSKLSLFHPFTGRKNQPNVLTLYLYRGELIHLLSTIDIPIVTFKMVFRKQSI